jgi:hypothetical protein
MKIEGSDKTNIIKPSNPMYFKNWKKMTAPAPCSARSLDDLSMLKEKRPVFVPQNGR